MAAWVGAAANNFRGTMGHQFRSGLSAGDSIPLFVPQLYRTIDLQNNDGESVDLLVRVLQCTHNEYAADVDLLRARRCVSVFDECRV
jgi:hypothetical protein